MHRTVKRVTEALRKQYLSKMFAKRTSLLSRVTEVLVSHRLNVLISVVTCKTCSNSTLFVSATIVTLTVKYTHTCITLIKVGLLRQYVRSSPGGMLHMSVLQQPCQQSVLGPPQQAKIACLAHR